MMHANACCTCSLISTCDMLGYYNWAWTHYSDDFTNASFQYSQNRNANPNQCSTSCQFTPLAFCQFIIRMGCYNNIYMLGNNGHTRCAYTPSHGLKLYYHHGYMHVSILHVCTCTTYGIHMVFKAIFITNTTDSYGRVRMMHLAFKEFLMEGRVKDGVRPQPMSGPAA